MNQRSEVRGQRSDEGQEPQYQKFEGLCPECGQPFCMEYVRQLEATLKVMKQAVEQLEQHCSEKDKVIESMRSALKARRIIESGPLIVRGRG